MIDKSDMLNKIFEHLLGPAKKLSKLYPEGSYVDFVNPRDGRILAQGTIYKWDWMDWKCILDTGKYYRFNELTMKSIRDSVKIEK